MKRLLNLLSILTISGTAVPTIIAAIPYEKKEIKLENNEINKTKIVICIKEVIIFSSRLIFNNKLYFGSGDKNVYEYDPATEQQKVVITTRGEVFSNVIILNNKLYIGSWDHNIYEYDLTTKKLKIVIKANFLIEYFGVVLNNKIYFGSHDGNVYEYNPNYYNLEQINNYYLKQINNNSDTAILNELNYLNTVLDILQLKIINKTNNSVNIKIKNNLSNNIINIKYSINNDKIKIINLNELIKKAIFFKFRDKNQNLIFKEIKYINTNNLIFSNFEVTKKENSFSSFIDIKNICNNKEFINKTSNIKSFNIPACVYNSKYKLTFQILTWLVKNQKNKLNGWNINSDDEMKLTDFISLNYNENTEIINELSNNFDLSNINKQEQEIIIFSLNDHSDKFDINPNEKLQVNYYPLRIIKNKNILNLKQRIMGEISTKIVSSYNKEQIITLSIKEAMQILQKYNLLPDEITINEDNSIIFNGRASISSEIEGKIKQSIITFYSVV